MNKTDRLLAIVLELQRNKILRAEDLAATFETSVRTIYRDIQALSEAGVPVAGASGVGYSLMEGYFLPPVAFTVEEVVALLIGTDFIENNFDETYAGKAESSRRKIEAVLPEAVRLEADRVRETTRVIGAGRTANLAVEKTNLETLRNAILEKRKVRFRYSKKLPEADGSRETLRTAAPYGLLHINDGWMLIARCDLRQDIRHFRLSRMGEMEMLEETFAYPPGFRLNDYRPSDDRNIHVRLRTNTEAAGRMKESNYFFLEQTEVLPEGGESLVTLRVRHPDEILQWVLGWGAEVTVLEPESLRRKVREEAEKILKRY